MTQTLSVTPRSLRKLREWSTRYLPAEIMGTLFALGFASAAFRTTGDRVVAAIAGTAAENIGFYGVMAAREWRHHCLSHETDFLLMAQRTLRVMLTEFGPAEVLDSLVLRPMCMYVALLVTRGAGTGSLLGKLMADGLFYGVAIMSYETARRRSGARTETRRGIQPIYVAA